MWIVNDRIIIDYVTYSEIIPILYFFYDTGGINDNLDKVLNNIRNNISLIKG